ncbi:hypothetical protein [Thiofilum flexile]|uniref:hypothetical protein n=1 Tax=Thiofilum flexile TaxID=125627 RepID=UPI00036D5A1E|nr:hypothetical protein [Thiofilum flexile]
MKQVILSLGVVASLSACTVVPVPVAVIQPKSATVAQYSALPNALPVAYHSTPVTTPAVNVAVARPPVVTSTPQVNPQAVRIYQPTVLTKQPIKNLNQIAEKIYLNETGGKANQLVRWNSVGNYAVLGIGRFSWYPNNQTYKHNDTFPELLQYMQVRGVALPTWLTQRQTRGGPWRNRRAFDNALNDRQMHELQAFLANTKNLQANFMLERLKQARPELLSQFNTREQTIINQNYQTLLQTPEGLYALLDYVSFKGDGLNPNERYNNQGWGLAQVLLSMQPNTGARALDAFKLAAEEVLLQRIANAPLEQREARFLAGWRARLNTYQPNTVAMR